MIKTFKNRVSRGALVWAICLLALPLLFSCKKESPTVSAADLVAKATDTLAGYNYPSIMAVYPSDGATGVPRDTSYVIVFNIPIEGGDLRANISITSTPPFTNLILDTHFEIRTLDGTLVDGAFSGGITAAVIRFLGAFSPIPALNTVSVNIAGGIRDAGHTATLNNPGLRTFTTGAASDTTAPVPNLGSRFPAPGAINRPRTTTVSIAITEANGINPTTVNSSTFWLEEFGSGIDIPCTITAPPGANPTITLTPKSSLTTNMQYRVTLTTGVEDLSGNPLSAGTIWSFTTEYTDPIPGEPLVIYDPNCTGFDAAGTTAYVNWITNEATDCTLHYGRGNDVSLAAPVSGTFTFHGLSLGGLGAGDRYWMQFNAGDVVDITSTANTIVYGPFEFNTPTSEAIIDVHSSGTNGQILPYAIPNRFNVAASGIFMFYTDLDGGFRKLYGQRYDSTLNPQWVAPAPHGLYTANQQFYFQSAVEDEEGGVIVIASMNSATSGLYVKRINADGSFFNWGTDADAAGDNGLAIDNSGANDGTSPSAVPVYTGQVNIVVANGNVERDATPANTLFEDNELPWGTLADFSGLAVGDHVLDTTAPAPHVHRTVSTAPTNFNYAVVLDGAIAAGNTYQIAHSATSEVIYNPVTPVNNHHIRATPDGAFVADYDSGGTVLYTQHGYAPLAWMGNGDFIDANGTWGIIAAALVQPWATPGMMRTSGTVDALTGPFPGPYWTIEETGKDFSALSIIDGDLVYNRPDTYLTYVYQDPTVVGFLDIIDDGSFAVAGGEDYEIYHDQYCETHLADGNALDIDFYRITADWAMGFTEPVTVYNSYNTDYTANMTADELPGPNPLFDNDSNFIASGVANGDIVLDFTDDTRATVDGSYTVHRHALRLNGDIAQDGDEYAIIRFTDGVTTQGDIATVGIVTSDGTGVLNDSSSTFPGVVVGSVVFNFTTQEYAMVTGIVPNDHLDLSRNDIVFTTGDRYMVFRQSGVLYIWEQAGNIYCRTMRMANGTTQLRATASLFAGTQPHAIPDGAGNALLIYRDAGNIIRARLLNSRGATINGPIAIDTVHANMSIIKVEQDRTTLYDRKGAFVLYTYGGGANLAVQWVRNNAGTLDVGVAQPVLWPSGGNTITGLATTSRDIIFDYNFGLPYAIVTYEQASKIYARSVGQISWGPIGVSTPATGIQQKPRIYVRGPETIILWEDNRFLSNVGYGIFGMKVATNTGVKDAGWRANTSGADDYNGVAMILNPYNQSWPSQGGAGFSMCLMPYNGGTEAVLFWEDYRQPTENANIAGLRVDNFVP